MNDMMLRSMKWLASGLVLAMVAGGCKKSEPPPEPEKKSAEKKSEKKAKKPKDRPIPLPRVSPEEPRTEVSEYPVADEFADEAAKSVSLDHLEAELDSIEAEILGGG